jgi:hypothetical protein
MHLPDIIFFLIRVCCFVWEFWDGINFPCIFFNVSWTQQFVSLHKNVIIFCYLFVFKIKRQKWKCESRMHTCSYTSFIAFFSVCHAKTNEIRHRDERDKWMEKQRDTFFFVRKYISDVNLRSSCSVGEERASGAGRIDARFYVCCFGCATLNIIKSDVFSWNFPVLFCCS